MEDDEKAQAAAQPSYASSRTQRDKVFEKSRLKDHAFVRELDEESITGNDVLSSSRIIISSYHIIISSYHHIILSYRIIISYPQHLILMLMQKRGNSERRIVPTTMLSSGDHSGGLYRQPSCPRTLYQRVRGHLRLLMSKAAALEQSCLFQFVHGEDRLLSMPK